MSTKEALEKEYKEVCALVGDAQIKIARLEGFIHEQKLKVAEIDKKAQEAEKVEPKAEEVVAAQAS